MLWRGHAHPVIHPASLERNPGLPGQADEEGRVAVPAGEGEPAPAVEADARAPFEIARFEDLYTLAFFDVADLGGVEAAGLSDHCTFGA
eukprot:COSAG05_NODE_115_length_18028_cov_137.264767_10_plen_89_part_00